MESGLGKRRGGLVVLSWGVAFLVVGCGSGHSNAAFRTQAARLCRKVLPATTTGLPRTASTFDHDLTKTGVALTRLAHLRPPASNQGAYRDMLARLNRIAVFVQANKAKLVNADLLDYRSARKLFRPIHRDNTLETADARKLGLGACKTERVSSSLSGSVLTTVTLTSTTG